MVWPIALRIQYGPFIKLKEIEYALDDMLVVFSKVVFYV